MKREEAIYIKVFDREKGDVVFEGKVSTDVEPHELVKLECFQERYLNGIFNIVTNEQVLSLKGLQNNDELVAGCCIVDSKFSGVLYVGAKDKVLRKSKCVPSCECVMMSLWRLSHEECEKAFKCEMLEVLELYNCELRQIPREIGGMKKLKKLRLVSLNQLKSIPEEMGELSNLEVLRIEWTVIESLPKGLKELKMLKSISVVGFPWLQLKAEDLVVFSKLKHLKFKRHSDLSTSPFTPSFWEMVKSTTDLRVLVLHWDEHDHEMLVAALEGNGSIVDGGEYAESYAHIFKRNKSNHEKALRCVVRLLAIRRWRNVLNGVPKEMVRMIAMMLLNTRCDVQVWKSVVPVQRDQCKKKGWVDRAFKK